MMTKKVILALTLCALGGCELCVGNPFSPIEHTIVIHVEGAVASTADNMAISGATVILALGGVKCQGPPGGPCETIHLTGRRKTAVADAFGRYEVSDTLTYEGDECPSTWLEASAEGYQMIPHPDGEPGFIDLECTENTQMIDILLDPDL